MNNPETHQIVLYQANKPGHAGYLNISVAHDNHGYWWHQTEKPHTLKPLTGLPTRDKQKVGDECAQQADRLTRRGYNVTRTNNPDPTTEP